MDKSYDLMLHKVNDTKQVAGLVSIIRQNEEKTNIKIRIWDLYEGSFIFYVGNNTDKIYKQIHKFNWSKPYINFDVTVDTLIIDSVFVINNNNKIELINDINTINPIIDILTGVSDKVEKNKNFLSETLVLDKLPEPPVLSVNWTGDEDIVDEKAVGMSDTNNPQIIHIQEKREDTPQQSEEEHVSRDIPNPNIPKPDRQEDEMRELPDLPFDLEQFKDRYGDTCLNIIEYRKSLERQFEPYNPFSAEREDYMWWKVLNPVQLHELLISSGIKIRNFFDANVMMCFFRHGFLICGVYEDNEGDILLVFGFPSILNSEQQPFKNNSVWVRDHGRQNGIEGYWLIYYDPETTELLSWDDE